MASMPHNIERPGFHKGQYVGYGAGTWRIVRYGAKGKPNHWRAARQIPAGSGPAVGMAGAVLYAATLADLGAQLDALAKPQAKKEG